MTGYNVEILEASRELTAREKISIKDFSNAVAIDTEVIDSNSKLIITPADYAILKVHNEHSKNDKEYKKYLLIDTAGNKYVTGSESFFTAFIDIFNAMREEGDEEYSIEVYKKPSKNYQGKHFITCSIVP